MSGSFARQNGLGGALASAGRPAQGGDEGRAGALGGVEDYTRSSGPWPRASTSARRKGAELLLGGPGQGQARLSRLNLGSPRETSPR